MSNTSTDVVAVLDKANDVRVTLQGDAEIVFEQGFLGTEKGWGIIPRSFAYYDEDDD